MVLAIRIVGPLPLLEVYDERHRFPTAARAARWLDRDFLRRAREFYFPDGMAEGAALSATDVRVFREAQAGIRSAARARGKESLRLLRKALRPWNAHFGRWREMSIRFRLQQCAARG